MATQRPTLVLVNSAAGSAEAGLVEKRQMTGRSASSGSDPPQHTDTPTAAAAATVVRHLIGR